MKVYLSGGITNAPNYKEIFAKAKRKLEAMNDDIRVVDPSCLHEGLTYKQYIDISLEMLKSCDAIFMLNGYEDSNGSRFELAYARTVCLTIYYEEENEYRIGDRYGEKI